MGRRTRGWIATVLILSGIWFIIDGGWLTFSTSAGIYWVFGGVVGLVLLVTGVLFLASSLGVEPVPAVRTKTPPERPPASPAAPDVHRPALRVPRKWVAVVGAVFVTLLVLGYLFAAVPLVTRGYSVTVVTVAGPGSSAPFNATGGANLWLPVGTTLTGSWVVSAGQMVQIFVDYGSGYSNLSSSGSFNLGGASPYVYPPGLPLPMLFEILSASPVTVTISGTYSVPLLYL